MKYLRNVLLLLAFLLPQCQWIGNRTAVTFPSTSSLEDISVSFFGLSDSLIKEIPNLPNDYFMTENNIMKKEGYELDATLVLPILQQYKGIIIPTGSDTYAFKRTEGNTRVFLSGKWSISEDVDYFFLKCFAGEGTVEVFIFSLIDNAIHASEWIASVSNDSDCGSGIYCNEDEGYFIPAEIMSRRQEDTVFVYSFDAYNNLTEEYKLFLMADGKLLYRKNQ